MRCEPIALTDRALTLRACLIAGIMGTALAGCSAVPQGGPPTGAILSGAKARTTPYYLVTVSPQTLQIINARKGPELPKTFADAKPAPLQPIGVGDTVSVTIWESSGLFGVSATVGRKPGLGVIAQTPSDNEAVTLPNQTVSNAGDINIPFVGRVPAAGLTPSQVERAIVAALQGKTIAPQVLVSVVQNNSFYATVAGDVNHPSRVAIAASGTRLIDAIALAGGSSVPTSDLSVQLTRDGRTQRARLDSIVRDPTENIFLRPNDQIYLIKEPQTAVILGATMKNAQVTFIKPGMTLAELVGNGGGLDDKRADPFGVFVFRREPAAFVRSLGPETIEADANEAVPIVYQINMRSPQGYFVAQDFAIHNGDLVFVANTQSVQLAKLANLARDFTSVFSKNTYISPE